VKLTRINYTCHECLFVWRAPIWEPLWVSRLCFKEIHAEQHAQGDGRDHPLVKEWREWEQERIIKVLDEWLHENAERLGSTYIEIWTPNFIEQVRQVIKGESK
jgi:hypothetical protein